MNEAIHNNLSTVLESEPPGVALKSPTVNAKRYETAPAFRQGNVTAFQMIEKSIDKNYMEEIAEVNLQYVPKSNGANRKKMLN
jgi:hypothetical protein